MGNQNFIVINGKKYDAVTGVLIREENPGSGQAAEVTTVTPNSGGLVDGFVKPKATLKTKSHTPARQLHKETQRSQTLARGAVSKPQGNTIQHQPQKPGIVKQRLGVSPRRETVANSTPKSPHVQKYGQPKASTSIVKKNIHRPVVQAPSVTNAVSASPPVAQQAQNTGPRESTQRIIEAALSNAQSHEEQYETPKKAKRRRGFKRLGISHRALAFSSGALAAVLLFGFFAFQNIPNLSMRLAATRAGFDARMPSYQPSGFSFKGPIQYHPGVVTAAFHSNADNREYEFIQQSSNWNSDALLANYIVAEGKQYQTYLDKGRTLYIYDGSNATWVDDGIWYQIEGESDMTTDQLIRLASSI